MNTPRTLQTKRTRPKSRFRKLPAVTRAGKNRRQRAATTASPEDLGEVPGLGVPLALVVILLLHVAAITGIWIHKKWSSSADLTATKVPLPEDVRPERIAELKPYTVETGDTAESIARDHGVTVEALGEVNGDITEFQSGWVINLPPLRVASPTSDEEVQVPPEPAPVEAAPAFTYNERPLIQTADDEIVEGDIPGEMVEVGDPEAGRTDEPLLIRPVKPLPTETIPSATTRIHTVTKGQTFWSISRKYDLTVPDLEGANPGIDPNQLKIGAKLVIPSGR